MLQLLQQARQHDALQADAVEPVLAAFLEQDAISNDEHMNASTRDLLTMVKQAAGNAWAEVLQPATAIGLAKALMRESGQSDVIKIYEARRAAQQVSPLTQLLHCCCTIA